MSPAPALLDRRLLFFTGKGGVGKSTVTAATALLAAEQGKRVLLVEVDAKNNLTALFEHEPVGLRAAPGAPRRVRDADGHRGVAARVPEGAGPRARCSAASVRWRAPFDFVATAAPGVKEILTVGKVCWELRESIQGRADWDLIVVDAAATGHVISQLDAPARDPGARRRSGPIRNQTDWMVELLVGSRAHRAQRGHVAGGDAGERDHRARRRGARAARRAARRRDREPRAARTVHPRRRGRVRGPARPGGRSPRSQAGAGDGVGRGARRGPPGGVDAPQPFGAPRRPARRRSTCPCCCCRTSSCATTACGSRAWSPTRWARSSL